MGYKKTIFLDIDGTILSHNGTISKIKDCEILDGVIEKLDEWNTKNYKIIITTGRPESARRITEQQLDSLSIYYSHLLMDIGSGPRVVINDLKPDREPMAIAINLERNKGLKDVEI